jgi:WD40 repeat protein
MGQESQSPAAESFAVIRRQQFVLLLVTLALAGAPVVKAAAQPVARTDSHGDPLPEGALARIGTLRFRHPFPWCVAFSPAGKVLASGGYDYAVRLWDPTTGEQLRPLVGHTSVVESIAFSADGKVLGAGSHDGSIRLWDVATGKELHLLRGHKGGIDGLAFSPDGKLLASGSMDSTVRIWDASTGQELRQFGTEKPGHFVHSVAFSPDGRVLAAAGTERVVRLWDVPTWEERKPLQGHQDRILVLAFTPDSKRIATCSLDKTVRLWDLAAAKEVRKVAEAECVRCLALSADGKMLAAGDVKGALAVWETQSGRQLARWNADRDYLVGLAFSPDSKKLAAISPAHGSIRLWDPTTGKRLNPTAELEAKITGLALSPDGRQLARVTGWLPNETVCLWDTVSGKEVWRKEGQGNVIAVAFSPDGKTLASGHALPAAIRLWNSATGEDRRRFTVTGTGVNAIAYSPRGDRLAALCDQTLLLWDPATGKEVRRMAVYAPAQIAFSPDGRLLACTGRDQIVAVWDVENGQKVHDYGGRDGSPLFLTFSQDGKTLAARCGGDGRGTPDNEVGLWETATGGERCRLLGHRGRIQAGAYSPDGRILATAAAGDEPIFLWDPLTGKELRRLAGHRGWARALAFSADGKLLASAGEDTTVLLWDAAALPPARPHPAGELTVGQMTALWGDLAGADAAKAYKAIAALADHPGAAGPFLCDRLREGPTVDAKRLKRLVAELDAEDFSIRETASEELAKLGQLAEPALKEALEHRPSAEVARRARRLLEGMNFNGLPPDRLRALRAAEALERIGTQPAREALRTLAEGETDPGLAREAKAALERLGKR